MLGKLRMELRGPSPALVLAALAQFVALGGSSYAAIALSTNSVKSRHIGKGQVKPSDIARNAVGSAKVADGSLLAADFKSGQVPAGQDGPRGPEGPQGPAGPQGRRERPVRQGRPGPSHPLERQGRPARRVPAVSWGS
jgi:hypothetical protein